MGKSLRHLWKSYMAFSLSGRKNFLFFDRVQRIVKPGKIQVFDCNFQTLFGTSSEFKINPPESEPSPRKYNNLTSLYLVRFYEIYIFSNTVFVVQSPLDPKLFLSCNLNYSQFYQVPISVLGAMVSNSNPIQGIKGCFQTWNTDWDLAEAEIPKQLGKTIERNVNWQSKATQRKKAVRHIQRLNRVIWIKNFAHPSREERELFSRTAAGNRANLVFSIFSQLNINGENKLQWGFTIAMLTKHTIRN